MLPPVDETKRSDASKVWHIDDATTTNSDESHYIVGLMQADGLNQMGKGSGNCGDAGDVFPGSTRNATFNSTSNPNSKSYAGGDTFVSITKIPAPAAKMTVSVTVKPAPK
jgi:immune inhibitor A